MARFCGNVGYAETVETAPGVWVEQITERKYFGDVISNRRTLFDGESINSNVNISNTISIVADAYAYKNIANIRYVEWQGRKWVASSVEVERPRLTISIGDLYNGD